MHGEGWEEVARWAEWRALQMRSEVAYVAGRSYVAPMTTHARAAITLLIRWRPELGTQLLAVTNRNFGGMSIPGGKADEDEDIRRAAIRELREETGVVVIGQDLTFLAKGDSVRPGSVYEVHLFYARFAWGHPRDVEEGTHHQWVSYEELLETSLFRDFYERHLPNGVGHLRDTIFADVKTTP